MLRITVPANAASAKAYYARSEAGDYYARGFALGDRVGEWGGQAAAMLGLAGPASIDEFHALCDNLHPTTGAQLTRSNRPNRRPLYDFTFAVPKSVAVMRALFDDDRIQREIEASVDDTMKLIEERVQTRVRKGGKNEDRVVGNAVWLPFYHALSRPVDGIADPGDHIHACLLSLVHDPVEGRWKSAQIGDIKKSAPYFQSVWHANLARRLQAIGYQTRRSKDAFEIVGVGDEVIRTFSRRTDLIEQKAKQLGITDDKTKSKLGGTTRESKDRTLPMADLKKDWRSRLSTETYAALHRLHGQSRLSSGEVPPEHNREALDWALEHLLERESVISEEKLLTTALKRGVGEVGLDGLKQAIQEHTDLIRADIDGVAMLSREDVLAEEDAVLEFARERRGRLDPLNEHGTQPDERLSTEQRLAVWHIWNSRDPITILRGKAGAGKTTMMRETIAGITRAPGQKSGGHPVAILAPTAGAAYEVLRDKEGFADATTVANFLDKKELQDQVRNGVLWVDEAGLLGFADMARLIRTAGRLGARVVLSGDRKQLRSPSRGEPLALLEDRAGLPVAELKEIRRQSGTYREAVEQLAAGEVAEGLTRLDAMGAVELMPESDKYGPLVKEYTDALKERKEVLLLSPSKAEGEAITSELRAQLKHDGVLSGEEREVTRLLPLHLSVAERSDQEAIVGTTAIFVKHAGTRRAGDRVEVTPEIAAEIAARPDAFAVYRRDTMRLMPGDKIRMVANARDTTGKHRLTNGSVHQIKGFDRGDVVLANGWRVREDLGTWMPGYVLTSYAGQGKTVDKVLLAVSAQSYPAANAREFYVDASRGRSEIRIHTDDRQALLESVARQEKRLHAHDLVKLAKPKRTARKRLRTHFAQLRRVEDLRRPLSKPSWEVGGHGRTSQMAR